MAREIGLFLALLLSNPIQLNYYEKFIHFTFLFCFFYRFTHNVKMPIYRYLCGYYASIIYGLFAKSIGWSTVIFYQR